MRRSMNLAVSLTVTALVFFSLYDSVFAGPPGDAPPGPKQPPPVEHPASTLKAAAPLVVLDIVATKGSKVITGLKAEDFTIIEDGKEQQISLFQPLQPQAKAQPSPINGLRGPDIGLSLFNNASQVSSGTRSVIVIDSEQALPKSRSTVRSELTKYFRKAPINDPVAIFKCEGSEMQMLQDFTTDRSLLERAAYKLPVEPDLRSQGQEQTLENFIATLAVYPGRKNLIWLAEWPQVTTEKRIPDPRRKNVFFQSPSYPIFESLSASVLRDWALVLGKFDLPSSAGGGTTVKALIDSDFVVYPIEPIPSLPDPPPSCYQVFSDNPKPVCEYDPFLNEEPTGDFYREMRDLAKRTGGKAYYHRINLGHVIRESINSGSTYYVLGYYPENTNWDGSFRHIEIRMNHHNIKLRYRPGYFADDPQN